MKDAEAFFEKETITPILSQAEVLPKKPFVERLIGCFRKSAAPYMAAIHGAVSYRY
jgi:hypothetical protein